MIVTVIDHTAIQNEIENKPNDAFKYINARTNAGDDITVCTTIAALLRAINQVDMNTSIARLQSLLTQVKVIPESVNFRNETEVQDDLIRLTNIIAKEGFKND